MILLGIERSGSFLKILLLVLIDIIKVRDRIVKVKRIVLGNIDFLDFFH